MKKLSESIWSDLQDRSSGDVVRREDDVNLLDRDAMVDYINNHYILEYELGVFSSTKYNEKDYYENKHYDWISIPICRTFGDDNILLGLVLNYVDGKVVVSVPTLMKYEFEYMKDFHSKFSIVEYTFDHNIMRITPGWSGWPDKLLNYKYKEVAMAGGPYQLIISPKDGSESTNKFYLEVLDYLIDNLKRKVLVKKK